MRSRRFLAVFFLSFSPFSLHAEKTCTDGSLYRVAKAADCLDHKDVGCAKIKLEEVLQEEPRCAEALFVQGWILQYDDGRVQAGNAMQAEALKLNPELSKFWENRGHFI